MNAGTGLRVTRVDRRRAGPSLGALVIGVGRGDRSGVTEEGESGDGTGAACISRPRSRWRMSDLTDKCDALLIFLVTSVLHSTVLIALTSVSLNLDPDFICWK